MARSLPIKSRRNGSASLFFDVDDFKSYNDNYSHMKGDEALRRVAGSVVGVLAAADRYLFRFGGEEFVAILPGIGEEEARRIAGALLTRCAPRLFQERTCRTGTLLRPLSVLRAGQAGN